MTDEEERGIPVNIQKNLLTTEKKQEQII